MRRTAVTTCVVFLGLCAAAMAADPPIPEYDKDPVVIRRGIAEWSQHWSPEYEAKVGKEVAEAYDKQLGVVDAPDQVERIRKIAARIFSASDRPAVVPSVAINNVGEPNAMALPGGYIRVTRGFLDMVQSDDELAGVLGHEIAHVCLFHGLRMVAQMGKWDRAQLIATILLILGAAVQGDTSTVQGLTDAALMIGSVAGIFRDRYSRRFEREADWNGLRYAHQAGYDPSGFYTVMWRIMMWEAQNGYRPPPDPRAPGDDHPLTTQRLQEIMSYFAEQRLPFNRAKVCRGFVATTAVTDVSEDVRIWEVRFGGKTILQLAPKAVGGATPEDRAKAIADEINDLTLRFGIDTTVVRCPDGSPSVFLDDNPVITVTPDDARTVSMSVTEYAAAVYRAFRDAVSASEFAAKLP